MSEIFLPYQPRPREDPFSASVVQSNLEYLAQLFEKGLEDGDVPTWNKTLGRYTAAPGVAVPTVGTSFPANPDPLQEAIVVDSLTSPSYAWRFIYMNGISDAYKWVAIGPGPYTAVVNTEEAPGSSATWVNLTTNGPLFDVPFKGYWDCLATVNGVNEAGSVQGAQVGISINDTTPTPQAPGNFFVAARTPFVPLYGRLLVTTIGDDIKIRYRTDATTSFKFQNRTLQVRPYRVEAP